jgi:hypothetical protein
MAGNITTLDKVDLFGGIAAVQIPQLLLTKGVLTQMPCQERLQLRKASIRMNRQKHGRQLLWEPLGAVGQQFEGLVIG